MADKDIKIKVSAEGGDQGAAEIRKIEAAIGIVDKSEKELAKNRAQFMSAAEAEVAEVQRLVNSAKKLEVAQNDLAKSKDTVTKKGVQMGTGMQNVGYQVQDLAVQIGSGTSAFRALGQQLPQLLSGFGPLGITLGTVSAVALPLAGALFTLGDSAEEAGKKAEEAAEKVKKFGDQRQARFAAAAAAENKQWLESLDDEYDAIKRTNDALQRSIDLLQSKRRAQLEVDDAKAAFEMAEIDTNPDLTDAQKIQGRAKIQMASEARKFDARREDTIAGVQKSDGAAATARGEVHDKEAQALEAFKGIEEQKAELVKLMQRIENGAEMAKARLPELTEALREADVLLVQALEASNYDESNPMAAKAKQQYQTAAGNFKHAEKVSQGFGTDEEKGKLKALRGDLNPETDRYDKSGTIVESQKAFKAKQAEAEAARIKAEEAEEKAAMYREEAANRVKKDREATTHRVNTLDLTSRRGATNAERDRVEKEAKQYGKEFWDREETEKREGKRQAKDQFEASETALDGQARESGLKMRGSSNKNATLQAVGKALADGTNEGELQKLGDMIREAQGKNGEALTALMMQVIDALTAQAKTTADLKTRIDKMP